MFKRLSATPRAWSMRLILTVSLVACLVWLGLFRQPMPDAVRPAQAESAVLNEGSGNISVRQSASPKLEGAAARAYVEQTSDGRSLMQAVTVARFGLKREEQSPFDKESGAGYLGMSHDQNLNAWFDEEGVTVRPTVAKKEREKAWKLGFKLKAYGYGAEMLAAPPVTARNVKENRIEYERAADASMVDSLTVDLGMRNADLRAPVLSNPQSAIPNPQLIEWYENRAEGIEQGFTLNMRPAKSVVMDADELLRVSLGVEGDLRARVKDNGQEIELVDARGKGALSYSKLITLDANGKQLASRMEASSDGREIALVVDDKDAAYPIVIDPIVASLEQRLVRSGSPQSDALFGTAVAIDGNFAVVGAPRDDVPITGIPIVDAGSAYYFERSGSTWTYRTSGSGFTSTSAYCGNSVAISGNKFV